MKNYLNSTLVEFNLEQLHKAQNSVSGNKLIRNIFLVFESSNHFRTIFVDEIFMFLRLFEYGL